MARPATGSHRIKNGRVYFRFRGEEWAVGSVIDWPPARIDAALEEIVVKHKAGVWKGPPTQNGHATVQQDRRGPLFDAEADDYYARQKARNLSPATLVDIEARIKHLKDFFTAGNYRMHDIDGRLIEDYQAFKTREREYLAALRARYRSGDTALTDEERAVAKHPNRTGLTAAGINRTVTTLAAIIERYQSKPGALAAMPVNPARDKQLKLNVTKVYTRSYLEPPQTHALFEAAKQLEAEARIDRRCLGRFEMLAVLICTGIRIHELCGLRRRDVDLDAGKLFIRKSKTKKGVREVWFSPFLADVLRHWMHARQRRFKKPDDFLFPTSKGTERDEDRFRDRILGTAVTRADRLLAREGSSPMPPDITPHALRRTYITYAGEAGYGVKYVMNQVGHMDSSLTVEVYNQLMVERDDPRIALWVGTAVNRRAG
jgi:integrase